jgi:hypothetical protein
MQQTTTHQGYGQPTHHHQQPQHHHHQPQQQSGISLNFGSGGMKVADYFIV